MKTHLLNLLFIIVLSTNSFAQYSGSFVVQGTSDKYYPVIIQDLMWNSNKATEFEIGRSYTHVDASWRGSLIAHFRVHTTRWGHGSSFINADIKQASNSFIADYIDATANNGNDIVIIWLKGGSTTYYFNSPSNISPLVYDGVQNALPYQQTNGPDHTYLTTINPALNTNGLTHNGNAFFKGPGNNYFDGNVGIGTTSPDAKLAVNGTIHSKEVKVDMIGWSDYVFEPNYDLPTLESVKTYIDKNHRLPEMPPTQEVVKNGLNLGEMVNLQMKKIEELTLYLIQKDKEIKTLKTKQQQQLNQQQVQFDELKAQLSKLIPQTK